MASAGSGTVAQTSGRIAERTTLYHYTSIASVEGILKSRSMWATLLHFMNDSQEWLYTLDLVRENLATRQSERSDHYWPPFLADLTQNLRNLEGLPVWVCSFSAVSNQLSQWRAYSPSDGGYELGFDLETLKKHLDHQQFKLDQCVYNRAVQRGIVSGILDTVIGGIGPLAEEKAITAQLGTTFSWLANALVVAAPLLKHPDFHEEQEWRAYKFAVESDLNVSYHVRGSLAVPHYQLRFEEAVAPSPITAILVGPNTHQKLAVRGLKAVARSLGSKATITLSDTLSASSSACNCRRNPTNSRRGAEYPASSRVLENHSAKLLNGGISRWPHLEYRESNQSSQIPLWRRNNLGKFLAAP